MISRIKFLHVKQAIVAILSSCLEGRNVLNVAVMGLDCRKFGGGEFSSFIVTLSKSCQAFRSANSIKTGMYCCMSYAFLENEKKQLYLV